MECDKGFSSSYMILKPEEVKLFDLIRILFSSDLEKRQFVDSAESTEESFGRRWIIFISIVVQKMLQFFSKPLAFIGSVSEMWLNLLSLNGNVFKLLFNVIRGKAGIPDKASANFISFIGNFDKRVELDTDIQPGDTVRYQAALSMMASKASYENKAYLQSIVNHYWKMDFLGFYDYWNDYQEKATTQAFIFRDKTDEYDTVVIAFRGTEPFDADAWCSDFDISWYELKGVGRIHGGFMKGLGLQKNIGWPKEEANQTDRKAPLAYYHLREMLRKLMSENEKAKYILTGHSLGGALAILFPAVLAFHGETMLMERLGGVYTFGQPKVGDETFGEFMKCRLKENNIIYYRFVYNNDMVPRLPYDDPGLMFKHFGTCIYSNRHYEAKVVEEEPNRLYFSPIGAILMMANAFMELVRSFTICRTKGAVYKEGWFMIMFRVLGLVIPGVPAHCPQDYVNATRLGSPHL